MCFKQLDPEANNKILLFLHLIVTVFQKFVNKSLIVRNDLTYLLFSPDAGFKTFSINQLST